MRLFPVVLTLCLAAPCAAQFGTPAATTIRERLTGQFLSAEGAPAPAQGDQIGVFFNNTAVGVFPFNSDSRSFSVVVYGDNPDTPAVEGPRVGQTVTFRFYDASTNSTRTDVRAENTEGEPFNYRYNGQFVFEIPGVPIDLTPTRTLNLRLGATQGGGGGGGGGGDAANKYDVDANGKVDTADAAAVLRVVLGGGRGLSDDTIERADVTGDDQVTTADAIEVMRNR